MCSIFTQWGKKKCGRAIMHLIWSWDVPVYTSRSFFKNLYRYFSTYCYHFHNRDPPEKLLLLSWLRLPNGITTHTCMEYGKVWVYIRVLSCGKSYCSVEKPSSNTLNKLKETITISLGNESNVQSHKNKVKDKRECSMNRVLFFF